MLTGACDACHETASFADHLAGMRVRCTRCGEGWVRIPPTSGVTASAPDFVERRPTAPPDTATTDQRPMPAVAPDMDHHPVAGTCPHCGSAAFKRVKAERGTVGTNDRECKECGTRYTAIPAPMSQTVEAAMYVSGVVLVLGGFLPVLIWLGQTQGAGARGAPSFPVVGVIISLVFGVNVLGTPARVRQLREKRLKEFQASAPPGAPPPVEIPRPPDTVFLSGLFGTLALMSPLVTSLLMVVLFGPAAVVCGIAALSQGHLKGLIGTALGVVGLIVWGFVFFYFFSG